MIHKKINLADKILAWEHERFSIRRMLALSLSQLNSPSQLDRATIFDKEVNQKFILDNTKVITKALLCMLYNLKTCMGQFFIGSLAPQAREHVDGILCQESLLRQSDDIHTCHKEA